MTIVNQSFYFKEPELLQATFLALRDWLLQFDENITETTKYGAPCFLYQNKILVYLWKDKSLNEPYLLFANGNLLTHAKLERGDRKVMKIYRIPLDKDMNVLEMNLILTEAIEVCIAKHKLN